jgi:hypothetical protein
LATPDNDPKEAIKQLTKDMEEQIRGGTLDAPSWEILRVGNPPLLIILIPARTAQRLYAPLGTNLSLGEYVRLTQRFVDLFAHKKQRIPSTGLTPKIEKQQFDFSIRRDSYAEIPEEIHIPSQEVAEIDALARDLKVLSQKSSGG